MPWSLILEGEELLTDLSPCLKSLAIGSKPWSFHTLAKKKVTLFLRLVETFYLWKMSYFDCIIIRYFEFSPVIDCTHVQSCLTLCDPMDCSPARLFWSWDFSGKNTGVDCHFLLQGIVPTQGLYSHVLHCSGFCTHWAIREALSTWILLIHIVVNMLELVRFPLWNVAAPWDIGGKYCPFQGSRSIEWLLTWVKMLMISYYTICNTRLCCYIKKNCNVCPKASYCLEEEVSFIDANL